MTMILGMSSMTANGQEAPKDASRDAAVDQMFDRAMSLTQDREQKTSIEAMRKARDTRQERKIDIEPTPMPAAFNGTQRNCLIGGQYLNTFWTKLSGADSTQCKVMMIGDSHVAGQILPNTLEQRLKQKWPFLGFKQLSKNGVQINYFLDDKQFSQVVAYKPDLLIVSVGTNEAHGNFVTEKYQTLMQRLVDKVHAAMPQCVMLFTTGPGSHNRTYGYRTENGKRVRYVLTKTPNDVNQTVADCQVDYCRKNNIAIWDMYDIVGGKANACNNWVTTKLMRDDYVHFYKEGYQLQGNMLFDAIYGSYWAWKK